MFFIILGSIVVAVALVALGIWLISALFRFHHDKDVGSVIQFTRKNKGG
jgi:hypothetical protein